MDRKRVIERRSYTFTQAKIHVVMYIADLNFINNIMLRIIKSDKNLQKNVGTSQGPGQLHVYHIVFESRI